MKAFIVVIIVSTIIGGFVGGELSDRTFLLTGAVIGGVGVAAVLLGLGAFFSWQEERKKKQRGNLPPEIREVFGRIVDRGLQRQADAAKKSAALTGASSSKAGKGHESFKRTIEGLVSIQLLPKYSNPKQAFGDLMTNKRAAGYLFGLHDAMLQVSGLRNDLTAANKLMEESYQTLFGNQAGYALFSLSQNNQEDTEFHGGRMEGGEELTDFVDNKTPPLGLGRMLILDSGNAPSKAQVGTPKAAGGHSDFSKLIFEMENIFRGVIQVPAPSDTLSKVLQRDAIYGAISPFAYGLIVMKRATQNPAFIDTQEHSSLFMMVENRMTKNRLEVTSGMANSMPMMPGGPVFEPDAGGIRRKVRDELLSALNAVADRNTLRSLVVAKPNLLQTYIAAAPFSKAPEQKEALFEAMSNFADDYLRSGA